MTQEDKAKAYDEALKRAKLSRLQLLNIGEEATEIEYIFPELKECEDEYMKNWILDELRLSYKYADGDRDRCEELLKAIAWLEKQDDKLQGKTIQEEKTDNDNNVEPKSEIIQDTWYICTHTTCSEDSRIWFKKNIPYLGKEILKYDLGFEPNDYQYYFRLWTIQDAKEGDVLNANGAPFIYKKHDKDYVYFYCGINLADEFIKANGIDPWNNNNKVYPATKEQRELLFSKMKDAGYEFDFEKKELRKIEKQGEQKPKWGDDDEQYLLVCKNALHKYQVSDKWDADIISKWLDDKLKQGEQKPKWSDEDDTIRFELIKRMEALDHYWNRPTDQKLIDWIKSLKERILY